MTNRTSAIFCQCCLPQTPLKTLSANLDPKRSMLLRTIDRKWVNGTVLRYAFFEGHTRWDANQVHKDVVHKAFTIWTDVGIGLQFQHVQDLTQAEVRIGFQQDNRSWSGLGRDILKLAEDERTMNLGWDITQSGRNGLDTAVHEIGHTLGFPHEHQNPNAGIEWDIEAVYDTFGGPPNNWSRDMIDWNILRKLPEQEFEGSVWDPNSIMHYSFPEGVIVQPEKYQSEALIPKEGLSELDKKEVTRFYPPLSKTDYAELKPLDLKSLEIAPGEQLNFVVRPEKTTTYNFRTYGEADTVIVLFRDLSNPRYVMGADDTGTDKNASFAIELNKDEEYILRVRLYWRNMSAKTALMMW